MKIDRNALFLTFYGDNNEIMVPPGESEFNDSQAEILNACPRFKADCKAGKNVVIDESAEVAPAGKKSK